MREAYPDLSYNPAVFRIVTSVVVGLATAACALVVWVAVQMILGLIWLRSQVPDGAGALGAVSGPVPGIGGLIAMLLGFVAGFVWMQRRR